MTLHWNNMKQTLSLDGCVQTIRNNYIHIFLNYCLQLPDYGSLYKGGHIGLITQIFIGSAPRSQCVCVVCVRVSPNLGARRPHTHTPETFFFIRTSANFLVLVSTVQSPPPPHDITYLFENYDGLYC